MAEERTAPSTGSVSFAAPASGFFDGGDRGSHLEQLRHLSQWSRRVLLVTGARGAGKTVLYRQLSASLEPRAKAARISGSLVNGAREVLNATVQGFGLAAPAEADTQVLRALIRDHARAQDRSDRFCLVLVDDADLLEPKALEHLLELAADSPLRMVLFGEVRVVPAVERLAEPRGVGWHEIRLAGFDVGDTQAYLQWRMRAQGSEEALPFSETQIREIARLSEGLPGRVDQMANVLLARIRSAGEGPPARRFPPLHTGLVAVLVVALALAYLLLQTDPARESETLTRSEPLEVPARTAAGAPPPDAAPAIGSDQEPAALADEPAAAPAEAPATPAEVVSSEADPAPEAAVADREAGDPQADVGVADAADGAGNPESAPQPSVAEPSVPKPPGPRDEDWIMAQPAGAWTLQLASFSSSERADAFLARQRAPEQFARYRLRRGGRELHVVVFGRFDTRAAAEQAATRLPASVGKVDPWIRTFAQVQDAARTADGGA